MRGLKGNGTRNLPDVEIKIDFQLYSSLVYFRCIHTLTDSSDRSVVKCGAYFMAHGFRKIADNGFCGTEGTLWPYEGGKTVLY